ncbi:DUF4381 domain-containing protein [Photobacterium sanctipauli]|uniref:DUF4381 domain-containing protein n=1 Tax=Photobacterium sanctipauli TaxID=1342794 RepID=A0A2T3P007_9GAMM|nr:DUF4381 domain-containing protein [Photobacterium sanctipauli]PSW21788.1 DUF4381 domain-containing protein [Photobacterium sanctipauli]
MTNEQATPLLPLADLHLPEAPGVWPLAWGWWAVIILGLVIAAFVLVRIRKANAANKARKEALNQLKQLKQAGSFNQLNLLLRQVAMSYYPRQDVAGLTGTQWLAFLDSSLPAPQRGFEALAKQWQQGLFSNQALSESDFNACYKQAELWMKKAKFNQEVSDV